MDNLSSFADVPIIRDMLGHSREMLSIEHVTVVANLHWEKMQALLQALCNQMHAQAQELQNQALRLSKVEEQEKKMAALQAELDAYKNAMRELQEARQRDAEQERDLLNAFKALEDQEARTKKLEDQFGNLRDGLNANNLALKDMGERLSFVEQDLLLLKPLPQCMDALEGNMKKLNAATANLQQSFLAVDFGRLARMASMMQQQPVQQVVQQIVQEPADPPPQVEPIVVYQPDFDLAAQVDELARNLEGLNSKFTKQNEQLQNLETQNEQLRLLIDQLAKSYALDVEGLRKSYKALRQELDAKPLLSLPESTGEEPSSRLEAIVAELQSRLLRKAEEDAVNAVATDVQRLNDSLEQMRSTLSILRRRTSSLAAPSIDNLEARMRKAEDDLIGVGTSKADRAALDALELKLSLLGSGEPKGATPVDTSALQGLTDMLTKKADRNELSDLRMMIQSLASRSSGDDIRRLFDDIEELRSALADLNLLAQAPVVVPTDYSDLRAELDGHTRRILEHTDLFLQIQAALEKKADQASFLFLKDMMETLKQNRKSRTASFSSGQSMKQFADETSLLHQMWGELMDTLNDHERVLQQLTQGVLIMSGHSEEEKIDTGITSAFQPELSLDDSVADASEISRPATAFSKSEAYYPTTAPVSMSRVDNMEEPPRIVHQVDERQRMGTPDSSYGSSPSPVATRPPQLTETLNSEPPRVSGYMEAARPLEFSRGVNTESEFRMVPAPEQLQPPQETRIDTRLQPPETPQSVEPVRPVQSYARAVERSDLSQTTETVESRSVDAAESRQTQTRAVGADNGQSAQVVQSRQNVHVETQQQTDHPPPPPPPPRVPDLTQHVQAGVTENLQQRGPSPRDVQAKPRVPSPRAPDVVESKQRTPSRAPPESKPRVPSPRALESKQRVSSPRAPEVVEAKQRAPSPRPVVPENRPNSATPENNRPGAPEAVENAGARVPDIVQNTRAEVYESRQNARTPPDVGHRPPETIPLPRSDVIPVSRSDAIPLPGTDVIPLPRSDAMPPGSRSDALVLVSRSDEREYYVSRDVGQFQQASAGFPDWRRNLKPPATGPSDAAPAPRPLDSTYTALELALKENKIRAKENVRTKDLDALRIGIEELRSLLSSMQLVKADKHALEELWQYVKANVTENAMFSGKPLLGFKCMSCEHSIEKLNPFRSDYLPTNMMPKQWLSMFTAERLFSGNEKREPLPPPQRSTPSPPRTGAVSPFPKPATAGAAPTGNTTPEPIFPPAGGYNRQEATTPMKTNVQLSPKIASIPMRK